MSASPRDEEELGLVHNIDRGTSGEEEGADGEEPPSYKEAVETNEERGWESRRETRHFRRGR